MKILSHADAKNTQKGVRISNFLLLMVVLKGHRGSEGVKCGLHSPVRVVSVVAADEGEAAGRRAQLHREGSLRQGQGS